MIDVSVIIPVYNTEKYLAACVDSILNQADVSLEIILVDDGSTDLSASICDNYAKENDDIKAIHIQKSGPATAKNEGLKHAQGNYIALTDSDDKMEPLMLHKMVSAGYEHNADIICCNYKQIDERGHVSHLNSTNQKYVLNHEEGLIHFFSKDKIYSQCWTKIYKRETMDLYHVRNREGLKTEEDFIYNIQAFACSKTVCIVDKPLYIYTHRSKSLSKDYYKNHINQYIDNRIIRLELVDRIIHERFPHLQEYCTYHCIFYYNELIGRICQFPELYHDSRTLNVITYIKKHSDVLMRYNQKLGFSKNGVRLIIYLPSWLYLYYRHWKFRKVYGKN